MVAIVAGVVVFGLLIFIHEFGHYIVARMVGIGVHEFSLGFGPRIWGIVKGKTEYNLRAFPLGGFVRLVGMDPKDEERGQPYSFARKPVLPRVAVILAGPVMNFALAAVALAVLIFFQAVPPPTTRVGEALAGYPAAAAGIRAGDRIVAVDGRRVSNWEDIVFFVSSRPEKDKVVTVERDGRQFTVTITPRKDENGNAKIGLKPERVGLFQSLIGGVEYTGRITKLIIAFLGKMFVRDVPADIGGPVRVAVEIGRAAKFGLFPLIQLTAFLSINLGLFNLFPVPALDGARIGFLVWEGVTRRPVDPEKENVIHLLGFALLILLMVVVTYHDIIRLAVGIGG
ncbi:MAG: RIP metalloprotease RseP [Bacillota bacterium]